MNSSREAAEQTCGRTAVENYIRVKQFYTRFGHALEQVFATAVGGRVLTGRGPDVLTELGKWAFAAQQNTKNSGNNGIDLASVPFGHCVQVFGRPNPGWISGVDFLARHGYENPGKVVETLVREAIEIARDGGEQLHL